MDYDIWNYDTIEVRRKKRNWFIVGCFTGFFIGFLIWGVLI